MRRATRSLLAPGTTSLRSPSRCLHLRAQGRLSAFPPRRRQHGSQGGLLQVGHQQPDQGLTIAEVRGSTPSAPLSCEDYASGSGKGSAMPSVPFALPEEHHILARFPVSEAL